MIKINIDKELLAELITYHTNYVKATISESWNTIVGTMINGKQVTANELLDIKNALDHNLSHKVPIKLNNVFLSNIIEICTTQNLDTYAIPNSTLFPHQTKRYVDILLKIIGYHRFNKGDFLKKYNKNIIWNRHTFIQKLGVTVCPYCNRQYITSFHKNNRCLTTADIDHYYPKTQYPLLSMNFFNMVPSCTICNSKLKGKNILKQEDMTLNPFFDDSDCLYFTTNNDQLNEMYQFANSSTKIYLNVNSNKDINIQKRAQNSKKVFYLPNIYNAHVQEIAKLKENINHFSEEYFDNVFQENYKGIFKTYEEFKKTLFDFNYLDDGDAPLSKLKKDIYNQLMGR